MIIVTGIYRFGPKPTAFRNDFCLTCQSPSRSIQFRSFDAFHLFWIPILPLGGKLARMTGATLQTAYIPLPSGAAAIYNSSGLAYYRHTDHLGSSRFASTPTQTMYASTAYSAFGEPYAQTTTKDPSFTGQDQDTTPGVYDFLYRKYDPGQSRWTSPDPAGLAAVDPTSPQSWNRYAYVTNSPTQNIDPIGLWSTCDGPEPCGSDSSSGCDPSDISCGGTPCIPPGCGGDPGGGGFGLFGPDWIEQLPISIGLPIDPNLIIQNFHKDDVGLEVGDYPWQQLCLGTNDTLCVGLFWDPIRYGWVSQLPQEPRTIGPRVKIKPPSWGNFFGEFLPCYAANLADHFVGDEDRAKFAALTVAGTIKPPLLGGAILVGWTAIGAFTSGSTCAIESRSVYQ